MRCQSCGGSGRVRDTSCDHDFRYDDCHACGGRGHDGRDFPGYMSHEYTCSAVMDGDDDPGVAVHLSGTYRSMTLSAFTFGDFGGIVFKQGSKYRVTIERI